MRVPPRGRAGPRRRVADLPECSARHSEAYDATVSLRSCCGVGTTRGVIAVAMVLAFCPLAAAVNGVALPVVRCWTGPDVSGFLPQFKPSGLPRGLTAEMSRELAGQLAFYSTGWVTVIAPRGWRCSGATGATGALLIAVAPNARAGDLHPKALAVTAYFGSPGTGEVGGVACPFWPNVRDRPNPRCPVPVGERVSRVGTSAIAFEDPAHVSGTGNPSGGPYPSNGVVVYNASKPQVPKAAQETCALPQSEHATCTAILNDFLRRYPLYRYPA
jgi:hypothetical protein